MRASTRTVSLLAGVSITLGMARALTPLELAQDSNVWVSGKSTMKDFRCTSKTLDATLFAPSAETGSLPLDKLVTAATVGIDVEKLDCGNGTMNEHMRKALNAKAFPRIEFKLANYAIAADQITLKGALTIDGQERPVELMGKVADGSGLIRTSASNQIDMTQWGVKPPSLMMGTMKVKPIVTIGYDVVVKR